MKTLLLFSGGKDSTYVLYKLLTETDDEITAIQFYKAEDNARTSVLKDKYYANIPALVEELKKIRDFNFIKKGISSADVTGDTTNLYTFFVNYAIPFLNEGVYDRTATGRTWESQDQKVFKNLWGITPASIAGQRLFDKFATRGELGNPLITHDFVQNFSRYHAVKLLPENLKKLTITCDDPKINENKLEECGLCYKCVYEGKIIELINEGYTSDQISEWRRLKSLQYGNGSTLSAVPRLWINVEANKGYIVKALDSKEKIRKYVKENRHHSLQGRSTKSGIWDFSNLE